MTESADRLYEIALDAIAQQRATVDRARGAVAPVSAAATAIAAALVKPAFSAAGAWATICAIVGAVGAAVVLACSVELLLEPRDDLVLSFDADAIGDRLADVLHDSNKFQIVLATFLSATRRQNKRPGLLRVRVVFSVMLAALVLEAAGFVLAAVLPASVHEPCHLGEHGCTSKAPSGLEVTNLRIGSQGTIQLQGQIDKSASGQLKVVIAFGPEKADRSSFATPVVAGRFVVRARPTRHQTGLYEVWYRVSYAGSATLAGSNVSGHDIVSYAPNQRTMPGNG